MKNKPKNIFKVFFLKKNFFLKMPGATSSLSQQLSSQLGGSERSNLIKYKASLLFDKKQAAQVDKYTILSIATAGLEDLISQNEVFKEFQDSLFSDKQLNLERLLLVSSCMHSFISL
jgi:hypothetical protein